MSGATGAEVGAPVALAEGAGRDPFAPYAAARARGEMARARAPLLGTHWMACSWEAAQEALRDQERFVRAPERVGKRSSVALFDWAPRALRALTRSMITRDGADHRRLRGLVDQAFARRSVETLRPEAERAAEALLDALDGEVAAGRPADLVAGFARPFPVTIISEMMGIRAVDRPAFLRWAEGLTPSGSAWSIVAAMPRIWRLVAFLRRRFEELRAAPEPGLMSDLVAAEAEGDRLTAEELEATVALLLFAGHLTTTHLISSGAWALFREPDGPALRARLAAEPAALSALIDALLRRYPPIQFTLALSAADQTFRGAPLARGEALLIGVAAAQMDPARVSRTADPIDLAETRQMAFGAGPHFCLGRPLALLEAEIALSALVARSDRLALASPDAPPRWTGKVGAKGIAALPAARP